MKPQGTDNPLDFVAERDFNPELIAASTSKLCRFTGRCSKFYSVAEHMQLVAHISGLLMHRRFNAEKNRPDTDPVSWYAGANKRAVKFFRVMLMAHLHDSMEHKIGDIATPIKHLPEFDRIRKWEREKLKDVYAMHDIFPTLLDEDIVAHADKYALSFEVLQLMDWEHPRWKSLLDSYPVVRMFPDLQISCWTPGQAEYAWLEDYNDLVAKYKSREGRLI